MFIDEARVRVMAGKGGRGCVSFRREKFVPRGGPDGGDGGDGGDVVVLSDPGLRTLLHLRHVSLIQAERGGDGRGKQCYGRGGSGSVIRVPPGTTIYDAQTGAWIADLVQPGDAVKVAKGGRGGKGNEHFKSPTRRAPRIATPGEEGETRELRMELRLLADVGLVGLPNVGKSTLLSRVSNARPRIGAYPFTTLEPNLGIVAVGPFDSFVMADIPGLVEGAHEGRGLGIQFLRHIERTRLLLFLIDSDSEDPVGDLALLRNEIAAYSRSLARRPSIVAFSRCDLRGPDWQAPEIEGRTPVVFSAHSGRGVDPLLRSLWSTLLAVPEAAPADDEARTDSPSLIPFAWRVDRGADLGPHPWPRDWFVGPVDEGSEHLTNG